MERLKLVEPKAMAKLENNIAVNISKYIDSDLIYLEDIPFKSLQDRFEEKQIKPLHKKHNKDFDLEM